MLFGFINDVDLRTESTLLGIRDSLTNIENATRKAEFRSWGTPSYTPSNTDFDFGPSEPLPELFAAVRNFFIGLGILWVIGMWKTGIVNPFNIITYLVFGD